MADEKAEGYWRRIKGKKVGLYATFGAYPNSSHARGVLSWAKEFPCANDVLGEFICQWRTELLKERG